MANKEGSSWLGLNPNIIWFPADGFPNSSVLIVSEEPSTFSDFLHFKMCAVSTI